MHKTIPEIASQWLRREAASLSDAERRVLQSAIDHQAITADTNATYAGRQTLGDRIADGIARVGGSWSFIIGFLIFLAVWTIANAWMLGRETFDPYPFVFLNLVLSMVAALQAPVIMMSQNRQAERDRLDASHDYEVNLKAEIEIMALHAKLEDMRRREIAELSRQIADLTSLVQTLKPA